MRLVSPVAFSGFYFMSKDTYQQKLKSPHWQRKRLEILQRDNFACTLCGDTETQLQVHHKSYKGDPWEIPNEQLTTLCSNCHSLTHELSHLKIRKVVKDPILEEHSIYTYVYCEKTISVVITFAEGSPFLHATYPIGVFDRIYKNKP